MLKKICAVVCIGAGLVTTGCAVTPAPRPVDTGAIGQYERVLEGLTVVPDGTSQPGYNRTEHFGRAWKDVDGNRCNTRDDILARDLADVVKDGNCKVVSGTLINDPYTGTNIEYIRGKSKVDIDHVVPLARAWDMGAWRWGAQRRVEYANDPGVLLAVDSSSNRIKGAQGPETWLPANESYHCEYAEKYIMISSRYHLSITESDKRVLDYVLKNEC